MYPLLVYIVLAKSWSASPPAPPIWRACMVMDRSAESDHVIWLIAVASFIMHRRHFAIAKFKEAKISTIVPSLGVSVIEAISLTIKIEL